MTIREEIRERIDKMDDAALPELLEQLRRLERRRRSLSPDFFSTLREVRERNRDLDEDEAALAAEAVKWARQAQKH